MVRTILAVFVQWLKFPTWKIMGKKSMSFISRQMEMVLFKTLYFCKYWNIFHVNFLILFRKIQKHTIKIHNAIFSIFALRGKDISFNTILTIQICLTTILSITDLSFQLFCREKWSPSRFEQFIRQNIRTIKITRLPISFFRLLNKRKVWTPMWWIVIVIPFNMAATRNWKYKLKLWNLKIHFV